VDSDGQPCNHTERPWLSRECKDASLKGLFQGKDNATILKENRERVVYAVQASNNFATTDEAINAIHDPQSGISIPRDYRLNEKDLTYMRSKLDSSTWNLHPSPSQSVRLLVANEQDSVVLYQEQQHSSGQAFICSIMTAWQRNMMIKYGHGGAILMDATAGTNNQKVRRLPCYIILTIRSLVSCLLSYSLPCRTLLSRIAHLSVLCNSCPLEPYLFCTFIVRRGGHPTS